MATAKNPGAGRGKGGGRPRRESDVEEVRLRLSPLAAEQLRTRRRPRDSAWQVVERLVLAPAKAARQADGAPFPPEVQEIARQAVAFLDAAADRRAAVRALRRSWKQALILANHDLVRSAPEELHPG